MLRFDRLIPAATLVAFWVGVAPGRAADSPAAPQVPVSVAELEARLKLLEAEVKELATLVETLRKAKGSPESGRIAELEKQIDALTREIEVLKLGQAAAPPEDRFPYGLGPAASKVYHVREGVSVGGYGEILYSDFSGRNDSGAPSGEDDRLDLLRAVLYFGYKWNDRILLNSEIEFEHATTGEGAEEKGEVSVEFVYLDFLVKKGFNARIGLVLVPLGIINEMHEPTTFPGVLRPRVETQVLPSTWSENGAGVFGETRWLSYRAYVVAGLDALGFSAKDGIRGGRQEGSQSLANDFAFTGRLDVTGLPGLIAGVSAFSGDAGQGRIPAHARVTLFDVHSLIQWRGLEGRGLWSHGSIGNTAQIDEALGILPGSSASVGGKIRGWYLQGAWDLFSLRENARQSFAPFLRYEALDTQDSVPSGFQEDPEFQQRIRTVGLTWKPIPQVAIKADYQDVDNAARAGVDEFHVGLGWIF